RRARQGREPGGEHSRLPGHVSPDLLHGPRRHRPARAAHALCPRPRQPTGCCRERLNRFLNPRRIMQIKQFFKSGITIAALAVGIAGIFIVLYAWQLPPFRSSVETTNNAYVKGQVTLIRPPITGYVVAVPVQDYMTVKNGDLLVAIDDRLNRQQLAQAQATLLQEQAALSNFAENRLAKQASLDLAKAQLQSAQAGLEKAELDDKRTGTLVDRGFSTQSSGDQTRVALAQARSTVAQAEANVKIAEQNLALVETGKPSLEAAVASAEASVKLAEINLDNTRIVAPVDGR